MCECVCVYQHWVSKSSGKKIRMERGKSGLCFQERVQNSGGGARSTDTTVKERDREREREAGG